MRVLKLVLGLGVVYFLLMSITQLMNIKLPFLYIYFNLPSHVYEQNIVAAFGLLGAALFLSAALHPTKQLILTILLGSAAALGVLVYSNISTNFEMYRNNADLRWYYMSTALFQLYWFGLLLAYNRVQKQKEL